MRPSPNQIERGIRSIATAPPRWFFSVHALERMAERGVTKAEVFVTLNDPEADWPVEPSKDGAARHQACRGRVAVIYIPSKRMVVTVLPPTATAAHALTAA